MEFDPMMMPPQTPQSNMRLPYVKHDDFVAESMPELGNR